jgi:hypothetical protein
VRLRCWPCQQAMRVAPTPAVGAADEAGQRRRIFPQRWQYSPALPGSIAAQSWPRRAHRQRRRGHDRSRGNLMTSPVIPARGAAPVEPDCPIRGTAPDGASSQRVERGGSSAATASPGYYVVLAPSGPDRRRRRQPEHNPLTPIRPPVIPRQANRPREQLLSGILLGVRVTASNGAERRAVEES